MKNNLKKIELKNIKYYELQIITIYKKNQNKIVYKKNGNQKKNKQYKERLLSILK